MYEQWCKDQEEEFNLNRSMAILIGSFSNPTAAQEMLKVENPDFTSTDQDFEKSIEMIKKNNLPTRKRQKKIIKKSLQT